MSASREKKLRRELREAEANSDIVKKKKKVKKPMSPVRAKKIRTAICSTIAIVLVVVFALLIFVNSGFLQKHTTALTIGEHKLTPAEFNYYYQESYYNIYSTYSSYGMWDYLVDTTKPIETQECTISENGGTWKDYISEIASQTALQVYVLYDAAMADGYTLDEETQSSIDALSDNLEEFAEANKFKDVDSYLESYYGKGCTAESYINYYTIQQIAYSYSEAKGLSFTYTDDELSKYYNENAQTFDKVSYRIFNISSGEDEAAARETAEAMLADMDGTEDTFATAAHDYAPEDAQESYEDADYTLRRNVNFSSVSGYDYGEWLFNNARVAGETEMFTTSNGFSVVMFLSRDTNDYQTVNVRHILTQVEKSGEDDTATNADWEACSEKMDDIVAEWEASDMTEETFAELANTYSDDSGSNTNGGLYENGYKGQWVTEFEDWCFAENRQIGDYGVIKTDYGYHLMYFSGNGDYYWKTLADSAKRQDDYDAWYAEYSESYTADSNSFGQLFTNKAISQ